MLPNTSNRSTFIVPGMLAILLAVPAREQQVAKAVGLEVGTLGALAMGGQPDLAAAGWESEILVCFLLGSAIEGEFLGPDFGSIDRTPGCCLLALYCLYLILNPSINHEADRDRLLFLDLVLIETVNYPVKWALAPLSRQQPSTPQHLELIAVRGK
ncbi:hypothetical protein QUB05_30830 [Microcoleus sp. F10-C6]|uniref:hypothetical protein n=1 Tax=unclassified Microcoleus TaxID=2642155 RepID=UPI002FCE8E65